MDSKRRRRIVTTVAIILALVLVLQLQPLLIEAHQGVDGSFGFLPLSNDCIGWTGPADHVSWLPNGDFQFQLGLFNFRYLFTEEEFDNKVPMCMGQDIWYGE